IALKPRYAAAHYNLGLTLMGAFRVEEAIHAFRQAVACNPDLIQARFELCNMRRHACDWRGLVKEETECLASVRQRGTLVSPFPIVAMAATAADQLAHNRIWARALTVASGQVFTQHRAASLENR